MAELKTIKEIMALGMGASKEIEYFVAEVRAEAIEWYKRLEIKANNEKCNEDIKRILLGQREILLIFFNLTEEDLK